MTKNLKPLNCGLEAVPDNVPRPMVDLAVLFQPVGEPYPDDIMELMKPVVKEGGTVVLFGKDVQTSDLILANEKHYKYTLIWYLNHTGGRSIHRPVTGHVDVIVFTMGGGKHNTYNPQMVEGKPYKTKGGEYKKNDFKWGVNKSLARENKGERFPSSLLKFDGDGERMTKQLAEWLIKSYTDTGGIVLTPKGEAVNAGLALGRRVIQY